LLAAAVEVVAGDEALLLDCALAAAVEQVVLLRSVSG
jgi:hypothetical protein